MRQMFCLGVPRQTEDKPFEFRTTPKINGSNLPTICRPGLNKFDRNLAYPALNEFGRRRISRIAAIGACSPGRISMSSKKPLRSRPSKKAPEQSASSNADVQQNLPVDKTNDASVDNGPPIHAPCGPSLPLLLPLPPMDQCLVHQGQVS